MAMGSARGMNGMVVNVGEIYKARMDRSNAIVPKDGYAYRDKFFVVLGIADDGTVYGGVVINSHVNQHIAPGMQDLHYLISAQDYGFLSYDSYIDCADLKELRVEQLQRAQYVDNLQGEHLEIVTALVTGSDFVTTQKLKKYHLI